MTLIIILDAFNYAIDKPFSAFWDGWTKVTLPSESIDPKINTWETTPAIFFSAKLGYVNFGKIDVGIDIKHFQMKKNLKNYPSKNE